MFYNIGFLIFSLFYLPALIFKGKLHAEFAERFAIFDKIKERSLLSGKDRIWIQAVSVGEVALCKGLIPVLKQKFPENDIVISTITKPGNDLAKKIFGKDAIIIYFPIDFSFVVKKAVSIIKPGLFIMIETEIWPNLLLELYRSSVPSVLINGRISDRSIGKYRIVKPFLKNVLAKINFFCMQDRIDAGRITELGAPADRVKVTGNMKFDAEASSGVRALHETRLSLGLKANEELLVAGSTHSGEEEIVVSVFKELLREFPNIKLLIAPRHIDRVNEVEEVIKKIGFESIRVSRLPEPRLSAEAFAKAETQNPEHLTPNTEPRILILDTIGHLNEAYSVATLVFMGGSLVRHGGHNPIEPADFGRAILFGPHMFNFKYIANVFLRNKAAMQVFNKEDLLEKCRFLLQDAHVRNMFGKNAKSVVSANRGATVKNIQIIRQILR